MGERKGSAGSTLNKMIRNRVMDNVNKYFQKVLNQKIQQSKNSFIKEEEEETEAKPKKGDEEEKGAHDSVEIVHEEEGGVTRSVTANSASTPRQPEPEDSHPGMKILKEAKKELAKDSVVE